MRLPVPNFLASKLSGDWKPVPRISPHRCRPLCRECRRRCDDCRRLPSRLSLFAKRHRPSADRWENTHAHARAPVDRQFAALPNRRHPGDGSSRALWSDEREQFAHVSSRTPFACCVSTQSDAADPSAPPFTCSARDASCQHRVGSNSRSSLSPRGIAFVVPGRIAGGQGQALSSPIRMEGVTQGCFEQDCRRTSRGRLAASVAAVRQPPSSRLPEALPPARLQPGSPSQ